VRGQRVRQISDVGAARRGGVERDMLGSTQPGNVRGYSEGGWRSAVIAQAHEEHAKRLGHT
jgi:hypothetical protein